MALWTLSGITRVSRYQKKYSPTHTYRGYQSSLICFIQLIWSMASSLFNPRTWQSFSTISKFYLVYLLAWHPPLHTPYISSPNHCLVIPKGSVLDNQLKPGVTVEEKAVKQRLDYLYALCIFGGFLGWPELPDCIKYCIWAGWLSLISSKDLCKSFKVSESNLAMTSSLFRCDVEVWKMEKKDQRSAG